MRQDETAAPQQTIEKKKSNTFRYAMCAAALMALVAAGAGCASYYFLQVSKKQDDGYAFLSNLFLNLVPEFLGLAVGIFLAAVITRKLAKEKFAELVPELVRLITRLRKRKIISNEEARSSVICSVKLLSEENLKESRYTRLDWDSLRDCPVCDLEVETKSNDAGIRICSNCDLDSGVWNIRLENPKSPGKGVSRSRRSPKS